MSLTTNAAINELVIAIGDGFDPTPIENDLNAISENTSNTVSGISDTNTKLDSVILNSSNLTLGTACVITSVTPSTALSSGTQTLIAANSARKGLKIYNDTNRQLFVALGTTANTTTSFSFVMPTNTLYEMPERFVGVSVSFSIVQGTASDNILVTSLT